MAFTLSLPQPAALCFFILLSVFVRSCLAETTAAVFLPGYDAPDWEALRGSVIASDESMTTYTVFCAQTTPSCVLDDTLPFRFAEGPRSLSFRGAIPGEITAGFRCDLAGTTAATCTGSSSFGSGFREGPFTGPTETSWTKTLSGSGVAWAVLTMAPAPTAVATTDLDGDDDGDDATGTGVPTETQVNPTATGMGLGENAGSRPGFLSSAWAGFFASCAALLLL